MTPTWNRDIHMGERGVDGGLEICHMSPDSFTFKQKIHCSFLRMEGHNIGHFLWLS